VLLALHAYDMLYYVQYDSCPYMSLYVLICAYMCCWPCMHMTCSIMSNSCIVILHCQTSSFTSLCEREYVPAYAFLHVFLTCPCVLIRVLICARQSGSPRPIDDVKIMTTTTTTTTTRTRTRTRTTATTIQCVAGLLSVCCRSLCVSVCVCVLYESVCVCVL